jgi:hypothetical protein
MEGGQGEEWRGILSACLGRWGRHKQGQQMEQCGIAPISQLVLNNVTR